MRFQGSKGGCGWTLRESGCTHGAIDGAQRHEALHVVGDGAAVSVPVGVLSSLHDELLALEVVVLETHPASQKRHREAGLHDAPFNVGFCTADKISALLFVSKVRFTVKKQPFFQLQVSYN